MNDRERSIDTSDNYIDNDEIVKDIAESAFEKFKECLRSSTIRVGDQIAVDNYGIIVTITDVTAHSIEHDISKIVGTYFVDKNKYEITFYRDLIGDYIFNSKDENGNNNKKYQKKQNVVVKKIGKYCPLIVNLNILRNNIENALLDNSQDDKAEDESDTAKKALASTIDDIVQILYKDDTVIDLEKSQIIYTNRYLPVYVDKVEERQINIHIYLNGYKYDFIAPKIKNVNAANQDLLKLKKYCRMTIIGASGRLIHTAEDSFDFPKDHFREKDN